MNGSMSRSGTRRMLGMSAVLMGTALAAPAAAEEREFCPSRPGLGTPACTMAPGRVMIETGLVDWSREGDEEERADTLSIDETLVRVGVTENAEVQLGWSPFAHRHSLNRATGEVENADRTGDAMIGAKLNLSHPDGSGFSAAVQGNVLLPVGRAPIGAGDWGMNALAALGWELPGGIGLGLTPEIDASVNASGHGRHVTWGGTAGIDFELAPALSASMEVQALRDDDPDGHATQVYGGVALAWQAGKNCQLDLGMDTGMSRASEDIALHMGISRRF